MLRKLLTVFVSICFTVLAGAQGIPGIDIEGPFVRVKRNDDGSKTIFKRGNDTKTLVKTTVSPQGNETLKTVYRMDPNGNPMTCNIYDGLGNRIYKTSFGYSRKEGVTKGKLVQERLYDCRVKRYHLGTKVEKPVHIFFYRYNADGSPKLPIGISQIEGKTAEEIFGLDKVPSNVIPDLSDYEEVEPANPNSRPAGQ